MSSETDHRSHFYKSDRDLVEKIVDVILERKELRDAVKARDLSLQASQAQISQLEVEKIVFEKGAKRLAKYEELHKDSVLDGVEEVIDGLEFLRSAVDCHRNRADAAERALSRAGASSIAEVDHPK